MSLNLNHILQKILNESIGGDAVTDAINNHNYVEINYVDEESNAPGLRLIQPYAYGLTMAGNPVLRAFQISGDTLRGEPAWKFFLLKRIVSWKPRKQTFSTPPPMQGYNVPDYNKNGDMSMSVVYAQAHFDGQEGDELTSLGAERAKTQQIKTAPKINKKNTQGPIPFASQQRKKNVYTSQPNSKKYQQYAKNIEQTKNDFDRFNDDIWSKAEAEREQQQNAKIQNTIKRPQQMQQGPLAKNNIHNNKTKDEEEEWQTKW